MKRLCLLLFLFCTISCKAHAVFITFPNESNIIDWLGNDFEDFNEKTYLAKILANKTFNLFTFKEVVREEIYKYYRSISPVTTPASMIFVESKLINILLLLPMCGTLHLSLIKLPDEETLTQRLKEEKFDFFNYETRLAERIANKTMSVSEIKKIVRDALYSYSNRLSSYDKATMLGTRELSLLEILLADYPEELTISPSCFPLLKLPSKHILRERFSQRNFDHFLQKTGLIEDLANREKSIFAIKRVVQDALHSYAKKYIQPDNRLLVLSKEEELLEILFTDNPTALRELNEKLPVTIQMDFSPILFDRLDSHNLGNFAFKKQLAKSLGGQSLSPFAIKHIVHNALNSYNTLNTLLDTPSAKADFLNNKNELEQKVLKVVFANYPQTLEELNTLEKLGYS